MKNWSSEKKNSWFSCSVRSLGQGHVLALAQSWWILPGMVREEMWQRAERGQAWRHRSLTCLWDGIPSSAGFLSCKMRLCCSLCAARLLPHYRVKCSGRGPFVYNLRFPPVRVWFWERHIFFFTLFLSSGFSLDDSAYLMRSFLGQ